MAWDRNRCSAFTRSPAPSDQGGVQVRQDLRKRAVSVPDRSLKQFAKRMIAEARPDHRHCRGGEMPVRRSRRQMRARQIVVLMAGTAANRIDAMALGSALDIHCMGM